LARKSPDYGILGTSLGHPKEVSYRDWRQVAGYFDGDGCADYDPGKWVLHPKLLFSDNFRPHLEMLVQFLVSRNIATHTLSSTTGAWKFGVGQAKSVRRMASMMWSHCSKKREEVKAILDYLDNKITGSQLVEVFNESVRIGNRTGKIRTVIMPYTRAEGQAMRDEKRTEHAHKMITANTIITADLIDQIRESLLSGEATNAELAKKYDVSPAAISRAMFGRNDHN
jgi:hypothetical protein